MSCNALRNCPLYKCTNNYSSLGYEVIIHSRPFRGPSIFARQCAIWALAVNLLALLHDDRNRDYTVGVLTGRGREISLSSTASKPALAHTQLVQCVLVALPRGWSGWDVKLFSYLHTVLIFKCVVLYLHSHYWIMVWFSFKHRGSFGYRRWLYLRLCSVEW